ncbi:MAG TPA: protein kinase [Bacteroidota bacterium]|nr:protein kinase [Bacteroidota bacterium]
MIGTVVSHYRIVAKLGEGGMGVVYRGEDMRLGRAVALKFIPPGIYSGDAAKERFLREAQSASSLSHPAICTIFAIEEEDGRPFIVMEYVEGDTLRTRLDRGPVPFSDAASWGAQIAEGLAAAHDRGIVHRDIKPENLMVRGDGRVQILDFGLARWRGTSPLSVPGSTLGTLAYMAPEQARGLDVDGRADIYSLGAVLYELLGGRPPFSAAHDAALLYEIVNTVPPPLATLNPSLLPAAAEIVMKCLSRDRESRYQDARELAAALRAAGQTEAGGPGGGIEAGGAGPDGGQRTRGLRRRSRNALILGAVVIIGVAAWFAPGFFSPDSSRIDSLAILPLKNASADSSLDYLSDGLTESIISNLSRLSTVKVMSRSSVFHFKGRDVDPQAVGKELGVRGVLVGRVVSRDGYVTISAELIRTGDNTQVWGDQVRRKESELFALQEDVAGEIVQNLKLRLTPDERSRISGGRMESAEAYELLLKGRYHWNKRTPEDLRESVSFFRSAVEADPAFADAYAGLADAYVVMVAWGFIDPETGIREAEANARRALELNERLSDAHLALAAVLSTRYDRDGALKEYRRAIDLNPNNASAYQWFAEELAALRRFDESFVMVQHALELDPLSQVIPAVAAVFYANDHKGDRAVELARKTLTLDPQTPMGHFALGLAWTRTGKYAEAIPELERTVVLSDSETPMLSWLAVAYAHGGKQEAAHRLLSLLEHRAREQYVSPYMRALVCTALGEDEKALDLLDEGTREHDGWMQQTYEEIMLEPLRGLPRYDGLVRRLGFVH